MILDEVNFRSQQQVFVIMTLLILRFAHKEIRAILPLFGQDRSSYRLVVIRPVSLQVHRHQRNVPGSRQGIVVAGKWLQTAIAVTRLKAVGILGNSLKSERLGMSDVILLLHLKLRRSLAFACKVTCGRNSHLLYPFSP